MKATGVVRRIDELGRIVIPKELRKNLHIKEGENIEIYTNENDNIILKKFSSLKKIVDFADIIAESIYSVTKYNTLIFDNDSVVAYAGKTKKDYQNKYIGDFLLNNLEFKPTKEKEKIAIVNDREDEVYYNAKKISNGKDKIGGIIVFSSEKEVNIGQTIDIICAFFENYLE